MRVLTSFAAASNTLRTRCRRGLGALLWAALGSVAAQTPTEPRELPVAPGPMRLVQPAAARLPLLPERREARLPAAALAAARAPSEFELYVSRLADGAKAPLTEAEAKGLEPSVRRFGSQLLWSETRDDALDGGRSVPEDYVVGPGDELFIDLWGAVEASLRVRVGHGGSITLPRVGAIAVAGQRFSDLPKLLRQRVAQNFQKFELALSMGELRSVRVLVTGFVAQPGPHQVSSLAGLTQVLAAAGGPTAVGSLRQVQHRRGAQLLGTVDLYELLLKGQSANDRRIQAGDVIHVPAVGPQVAVIGGVNQPAVFELKGEETVEDLLAMAGGLAPVANRQRAVLLAMDNAQPLREIDLAADARTRLRAGDVLRVHSLAELSRPSAALHKRVRVEGEVQRPGDYVLPAGATLRDALVAAGGLTEQAYLPGAELRRESVRRRQAEGFDRALRELEAEFTRAAVTRRERLAPPPEGAVDQRVGHVRLIERLRQVQPTGRVVLQQAQGAVELPALPLEDGDQLILPGRQQAVSVYGSVFNGGSFQFSEGAPLGHYLARAGGLTRGADAGSVFVLRADGSVTGNRSRGWWSREGVEHLTALPGDTLFVPEELDKIRLSQELKDWAQILAQFGLGAVALKNLTE
jgi:protein involved in polysaccharide export with SLBB domain